MGCCGASPVSLPWSVNTRRKSVSLNHGAVEVALCSATLVSANDPPPGSSSSNQAVRGAGAPRPDCI